jgi:hypothetical protein
VDCIRRSSSELEPIEIALVIRRQAQARNIDTRDLPAICIVMSSTGGAAQILLTVLLLDSIGTDSDKTRKFRLHLTSFDDSARVDVSCFPMRIDGLKKIWEQVLAWSLNHQEGAEHCRKTKHLETTSRVNQMGS